MTVNRGLTADPAKIGTKGLVDLTDHETRVVMVRPLGTLSLLTFCAILLAQAPQPAAHDIRPGPGITATKLLSDYLAALAKTPGDTPVYILDGKEPGGVALVAGGTYANEIAGIAAAILLVEHARVERGRLVVIPHANNSAASYTDPRISGLHHVGIETPRGKREFRYGARLTHRTHQGEEDPERYRHPNSTEDLSGSEARNLDRTYPGKPDGNLTQKIAYAIVQLLKEESVDLAFDLHESGSESRLAWMIVANPKNIDTAALAVLKLDAAGISMKLEPSSDTFRGLSPREWGDATKAQAFLFETPNPLLVDKAPGIDTVNDPRFPLARRVAVQLSALLAIVDSYSETVSLDKAVKLFDVPGLSEITKSGIGAFLK